MLESASNILFQDLTGIKPGAMVLSRADVDEIIYKSKRVRSKDYVFNFDVTGYGFHEKTVTTTARWKFINTGIAVYCHDNTIPRYSGPRVGLRFESAASRTPFACDDPQQLNTVLTKLAVPMEGKAVTIAPNTHFEEYKTLVNVLDQRVDITVTLKAGSATNYRATVILTGLEIFEGGVDE